MSASLPRAAASSGRARPRVATSVAWVLVAMLGCTAQGGVAHLDGRWQLEFQREASAVEYMADCVWEQEGTRISGACSSGFESLAALTGAVSDADVTLRMTYGTDNAVVMTFEGRLRDADVRGTWRSLDAQGTTGSGTFTATRR